MMFVANTEKVTVQLDSESTDPRIKDVLRQLCYLVETVDYAGEWWLFHCVLDGGAKLLQQSMEMKQP